MGGTDSKPQTAKPDKHKIEEQREEERNVAGHVPKKEIGANCFEHTAFTLDRLRKLTDCYDLEKKVGEGSSASVSKATQKSTGAVYAIKSMPKSKMKNINRAKREISIMKMMDHPNIIRICEAFEDHRNIHFVLEFCEGGELLDKIVAYGNFTEVQAAIVMQQIIHAVCYMHTHHVCHRDLKAENLMLMTKDGLEQNIVKVIDFGFACAFETGQLLKRQVGSPYYVAPEVLVGNYTELCDVWSCGVVMYVLLCGCPPFYAMTEADVLAKVRRGKYSFNQDDWKWVSEDAQDMILHLLEVNPADRYSAEQALNHDWIKNKVPKATTAPVHPEIIHKMRKFVSQIKIQKALLRWTVIETLFCQ